MKTRKSVIMALLLGLCAMAAAFGLSDADFQTAANADGGVTITKYTGWDADITIPAAIGGKTVTAIGKEAFKDTDLTSVVIPDSVKTIGDSAFSGNKLTSLTIGANVDWGAERSFGAFAYYSYWCSGRKAGTYRIDANWSLSKNRQEAAGFTYAETPYGLAITGYRGDSKRLEIPAALAGKPVKYIEGLDYIGLTGLRIPNGVAAIGDRAFYGNKLTSVTIPDGVTYIGSSAFSLNKLTSVTIPNSVTYIGDSAFSFNQLTSVTIPNSVARIEEKAFSSNQLTSVTIPNSVTYIGDSAFSGNKLTSVTIPNSVARIEEKAFFGNKLTSVTIPNSVTYIGDSAFSGYGNEITSFTIPANVTLEGSAFGFFSKEDYNNNGKKAGTYTSNGKGKWTYRSR